jgi:GntR family transcriptional regulator / MocR family aminotransferase
MTKDKWYHHSDHLAPRSPGHLRQSSSELLVQIDPRSDVGLQQQIYSFIRRVVLDGVLRPGMRIPSSRALADNLGVSRTTTLLAYEQLQAEGYVHARHGSGTYVASELPDDRPLVVRPPRGSRDAHPPLSRRGLMLAATPPPAWRISGPPRPFRIGVPALDLFPIRLWSRLHARRMRTVQIAQLDYGDARGLAGLREAIAQHVEVARGTRCSADQVVVVAGAQRGIELVCQLLLDVGEAAWLEEPGYSGARSALVGASARIVPVRVDQHGVDVEHGIQQAPQARLAYVTPSHQFPAGVQTSLRRRLALLKWAAHARSWIVEDDYDSEFRYEARPIPCLHGLDADGRVIYIGSFSKSLFPALRLGFLVMPEELVSKLHHVRRAADVHPPLIDQAVLADAIREGHYERHLRRMRSAYRERLEALRYGVDRNCGGVVTIRAVRTGLHAVADVVDVEATDLASACLARGVEMTPLSAYYMRSRRLPNAVVLGFGFSPPDAIQSATEKLAQAIDAVRRHTARSRSQRRSRA